MHELIVHVRTSIDRLPSLLVVSLGTYTTSIIILKSTASIYCILKSGCKGCYRYRYLDLSISLLYY